MWPAPRAEALVTALDRAETEAAATGRAVVDEAVELDAIVRDLAAGWTGHSGLAARLHTEGACSAAQVLSGHCLYLADVLRAEGSRLARALVAGGTATEVEDADLALTARLVEATDALAGDVDPDTVACLDLSGTTGDDPRAIAALWHSLTPAERDRLARDHPELGSVAGLPAAQRDALNRTRLSRLLDAGAAGQLDATAHAALEALAGHLAVDPDRHLLALHADGRAVVASADPDGADRVVTLVPGTGSSLTSIDTTATRAQALCDTESCVSVAWQGYHAPQDLKSAAFGTDLATAHATDLRDFASGLDAVDVQDGHDAPHAVIGYSYGSTVLGAAASDPRGLAADRMVHVGSPGAYADSLADQRVDDGGRTRPATSDDVASAASRWDPIPWWSVTGLLGALPGADGFGAPTTDVTEPGHGPGALRTAHSGYFDPGTVSLTEIGRLVQGRG